MDTDKPLKTSTGNKTESASPVALSGENMKRAEWMDVVAMPKKNELHNFLNEKKEARFDHLWKVMPNFRCPIIGTCLSIAEQKKIIRKTAGSCKGLSNFEIHHILMEYLGDENPISIKAERYIRNKYNDTIESCKNLSEKDLKELWGQSVRNGEMAGIFYVIATRSDISNTTRMEAFGEIHMIGHSNLHDIMKARKDLSMQQEVNERLAGRLTEEKAKASELSRANKDKLKKIKELEKKIEKLTRSASQKAEKPDVQNEAAVMLSEKVVRLEEETALLKKENNHLHSQKRRIETSYLEAESTCRLLKDEIVELINTSGPQVMPCGSKCSAELCPSYENCPKRILMIGGMTKMKSFYRDIVESRGSEFIYHDGYIKNRTRQLDDLVSGSDLILCPVNCNSHNACLRIKRLCKKYNKPFKMMPGSSLSAVSRAVAMGAV